VTENHSSLFPPDCSSYNVFWLQKYKHDELKGALTIKMSLLQEWKLGSRLSLGCKFSCSVPSKLKMAFLHFFWFPDDNHRVQHHILPRQPPRKAGVTSSLLNVTQPLREETSRTPRPFPPRPHEQTWVTGPPSMALV
jgi:hypothetical protein